MRRNDFKLMPYKDEVIERYRKGESPRDLADSYRVSEAAVRRFLRRFCPVMRSVSEANTLPWTAERRRAASKRLLGNPAIVTGKRWTYTQLLTKPWMRGERHHQWKGGTTSLQRTIRTSGAYRRWRTSIFQRDNYTCIQCGAHSEREHRVVLNADHIFSLAQLIQKHHITSLDQALQTSELWDITNGRTLCHPCHTLTETFAKNLRQSSHHLA